MSTFGMAIAGDEAGDVTFDETLIEVREQLVDALFCPAVLV
jgi:hypothetical protein